MRGIARGSWVGWSLLLAASACGGDPFTGAEGSDDASVLLDGPLSDAPSRADQSVDGGGRDAGPDAEESDGTVRDGSPTDRDAAAMPDAIGLDAADDTSADDASKGGKDGSARDATAGDDAGVDASSGGGDASSGGGDASSGGGDASSGGGDASEGSDASSGGGDAASLPEAGGDAACAIPCGALCCAAGERCCSSLVLGSEVCRPAAAICL